MHTHSVIRIGTEIGTQGQPYVRWSEGCVNSCTPEALSCSPYTLQQLPLSSVLRTFLAGVQPTPLYHSVCRVLYQTQPFFL